MGACGENGCPIDSCSVLLPEAPAVDDENETVQLGVVRDPWTARHSRGVERGDVSFHASDST